LVSLLQGINEEIVNWRLFKSHLSNQQLFNIYQSCYNFEPLYQLFTLINFLKIKPLREFCKRCISNTDLMKIFVSIPASKRHHHSFPGGLLAHSLETAFITAQNIHVIYDISQAEKEVTTIAALFHDIGKTKTLAMDRHTS